MARRYWRAARAHLHSRVSRGHLHLHRIDQLDIEDQIGLRRNPGMRRIGSRPSPRAIRQLPGDKQPALAANLHSLESLIESRNHAAESLRKADRLRLAELRLAVGTKHRLAVLIPHGLAMVLRRIELVARRRKPPCIEHLVDLVGLGLFAGPDLDLLIAQ